MLEVIGAGNPDYQGQDWADVWASSSERQAVTDEINRIIGPAPSNSRAVKSAEHEGEFASSIWTQTWSTTKRSFIAYWRTPNYAVVYPPDSMFVPALC